VQAEGAGGGMFHDRELGMFDGQNDDLSFAGVTGLRRVANEVGCCVDAIFRNDNLHLHHGLKTRGELHAAIYFLVSLLTVIAVFGHGYISHSNFG
jgi:hypothetical protein